MCVDNFSNNLVECVDFSDLSGATVGCFTTFSSYKKKNSYNVHLSGAENITSHDEIGAAELHISVDLLCGTRAAELKNPV